MRIIFFGTSPFAVTILDALEGSIHDVAAVVTRPPKRAGRGRITRQPPVAVHAIDRGFNTLQPGKLTKDFIAQLQHMKPDVMVSAAYGAWLPQQLLDCAPLGVVNVHPSLLPLYRGAAPVARAILGGAECTGVSFMLTDNGWDTGPILVSFKEPILPLDTAGDLEQRLSRIAAREIVNVLQGYRNGDILPSPQEGEAIYAEKISPEESRIDWMESAESIQRKVRAFQPVPGARTEYSGRLLKLVSVSVVDSMNARPGEIVLKEGSLFIQCGDGALEIQTIQPESKKAMDAHDFLRGSRMKSGEILGSQ